MIKRLLGIFLLRKALKNIKLLVIDVDGVLTDGALYISHNGDIQKRFSVKDGLGIKLLIESGIEIIFLSGGKEGATSARADQLGIKHCFVNIANKKKKLMKFQEEHGFTVNETAYIGDDLNDLVIKSRVNLLISPSDAVGLFLKESNLILKNKGGNGVLREFADILLRIQNKDNIYKKGWFKKND